MKRKGKFDLAREGGNCTKFLRVNISKCWEAKCMDKKESCQMLTDWSEERDKESRNDKKKRLVQSLHSFTMWISTHCLICAFSCFSSTQTTLSWSTLNFLRLSLYPSLSRLMCSDCYPFAFKFFYQNPLLCCLLVPLLSSFLLTGSYTTFPTVLMTP